MRWTSTAVIKKRSNWAVQVQSDTGEQRELTYKTKAQARYFAAVLSLGPAALPERTSVRIKRRLAVLPPPEDALTRAEASLDTAFEDDLDAQLSAALTG